MTRMTVGVSLKAYFGRAQALDWFARVAELAGAHPAVRSGAVEVFVAPGYLHIDSALRAFDGTPVQVAAQDVSAHARGAFTGEVTALDLVESGVRLAEIGHAERRRLFHETDEVVAAKTAAALAEGVAPVLCLGEVGRGDADSAVADTLAQLDDALSGAPDGRVIVAYEPVWAIGAAEPAPISHITAVTRAVRARLAADPSRSGSSVIYGGSAGPGLLTSLGDDVDGVFLGRFAHDPSAFQAVIDEAASAAGSH